MKLGGSYEGFDMMIFSAKPKQLTGDLGIREHIAHLHSATGDQESRVGVTVALAKAISMFRDEHGGDDDRKRDRDEFEKNHVDFLIMTLEEVSRLSYGHAINLVSLVRDVEKLLPEQDAKAATRGRRERSIPRPA